jgi:hypothetical protein
VLSSGSRALERNPVFCYEGSLLTKELIVKIVKQPPKQKEKGKCKGLFFAFTDIIQSSSFVIANVHTNVGPKFSP